MEYTENTCWKCGKKLNSDNQSSMVYTSNPPKYTCKDCEELINTEEIKEGQIEYKNGKICCYQDGQWNIIDILTKEKIKKELNETIEIILNKYL